MHFSWQTYLVAWYSFNEQDPDVLCHKLAYTLSKSDLHLPRQRDGHSCGVFAIWVCMYVWRNNCSRLSTSLYIILTTIFHLGANHHSFPHYLSQFGADWCSAMPMTASTFSRDDIEIQRERWRQDILRISLDLRTMCSQCGKSLRTMHIKFCVADGCNRRFCRDHVCKEWREKEPFYCRMHRSFHNK